MSKCILMHAPSSNRQILFDGGKIQSIIQGCTVRSIPLSVRRPTFKEAKWVYNHLSQINFETKEDVVLSGDKEHLVEETKEKKGDKLKLDKNEIKDTCFVSFSGEECPSGK
jgi:Bacteroidetes VLRF1 release factor